MLDQHICISLCHRRQRGASGTARQCSISGLRSAAPAGGLDSLGSASVTHQRPAPRSTNSSRPARSVRASWTAAARFRRVSNPMTMQQGALHRGRLERQPSRRTTTNSDCRDRCPRPGQPRRDGQSFCFTADASAGNGKRPILFDTAAGSRQQARERPGVRGRQRGFEHIGKPRKCIDATVRLPNG